jgi:hypothetical protein
MGAGAVFLLFIVIVVVAVVGGALYAIRAGFWVRETSPKAKESRDENPEHVRVEDEGNARFDAPEHEPEPEQTAR